jgi:hypothetical protein
MEVAIAHPTFQVKRAASVRPIATGLIVLYVCFLLALLFLYLLVILVILLFTNIFFFLIVVCNSNTTCHGGGTCNVNTGTCDCGSEYYGLNCITCMC